MEPQLPPGPPLPRAVLDGLLVRQARRVSYARQDRYGDIFAPKIVHEGTWVMLGNPQAVKMYGLLVNGSGKKRWFSVASTNISNRRDLFFRLF
jgi:hypothetical protein